ncbi:MAG TPA: MFS transporter [Chloroflexota bacterium]|nr:MFS transporter [Chloroflexota bacterium]
MHDPYHALRFRDFRLLLSGVFVGSFGQQMLSVALGWELYNRTGSALVLGGVGLAQVIPLFLFTLPAGHVADRYSRRAVVVVAQLALVAASLGLAALSAQRGPLLLIYGCLVVMGSALAFSGPASSALIAQVIPSDAFENATTWRSSSWQLSAVLGPAAGGFLVGLLHGATLVYVFNAAAAALETILFALLRPRPRDTAAIERATLHSVVEGIHFLARTPVLLAAITLDMFAVLFGGAVTLLPIYAKNILHVGPIGLGWLQASSSLGAVCMAMVLAHRPPLRRAGRTLLAAVAGFGLATIVFGVSRWFWLSLLMLALLGALDNVSVVIRSTLVLVRTPDQMRGRVGAVNSLFVGTSNQLGGFESGLAAQLFGPVIAVAGGGVATLLVVLLVAWLWPEMRNLRALKEASPAA